MDFKKIYLTVSVIALTCSQYAVASPLNNISHTHTQHTLELKPISNSFQIAAAVFLPDKGDDLGFNGQELNDNHGTTPKIDLCSKFPLSACPANSKCSKCTSDNKFRVSSCNDGYKLSSGTCVPLTCPELNTAYLDDVPINQVCSTISTYGKTCYQTCKAIDFSGYPITSCPANATCTDHPDCATTSTKKGNCSPIKKKVTTCTLPSQKLNANASGCVNKDDTCPTGYSKATCSASQVQTATSKTEAGSFCYACKNDPCPGYYACGGTWQYCTDSTCTADSSQCSTYCEQDYFPTKCENQSNCRGVYRNGYCSGSCENAYPYFCTYAAICRDAGGEWGGNKNCSKPCNIFKYNFRSFRCIKEGSSWKQHAEQYNVCMAENNGSTLDSWVNDRLPYDCAAGTYSSQSSCEAALSTCQTSMRNQLDQWARDYPNEYDGNWYLTDRYCN